MKHVTTGNGEVHNERTHSQTLHADSEHESSVGDNSVDSEQSNDASGNDHPSWTNNIRQWLVPCFLLLLTGVILVVVLVPVLNRDYDGPRYKDAGFDVLQTRRSELCDCIEDPCYPSHLGRKVRLSGNGKLLFVLSGEFRVDDSTLEIWEEDGDEWELRNVYGRVNATSEAKGAGIRGDTFFVHDFAIDETGSRIIVSAMAKSYISSIVLVYERDPVEYQNKTFQFRKVGESMNPFFLGLEKPPFDGMMNEGNLTSADGWGWSVSMSTDGNVIAVSAPKLDVPDQSYTDDRGEWDDLYNGGVVQAFQHARTVTNENILDKFPNQTWVPKGQLLVAERERRLFGQKVALAKNGDRLLATDGVDISYSDDSHGDIRVFNHDPDLGWVEKESVYVTSLREESDVFAVSSDGYLLVTGEANNNPSAYQEKPYRGEVKIYGYDDTEGRFKHLDTLQGDEAFLHFGASLAVSDEYTVVVGTGDTDLERDIARVEIFEYSNTEWVHWVRNTPTVDISSSFAWASVDISADAKRIAGGVPSWDVRLECDTIYGHGFVGVYDYNN